MNPQTLYDKLWASHLVRQEPDGTALIYIDRHLVHEVTSPQAFEGLDLARRKVWRVCGDDLARQVLQRRGGLQQLRGSAGASARTGRPQCADRVAPAGACRQSPVPLAPGPR